MFVRIIIVVMDSVGAGALPDAAEYGDLGADTLGNIARCHGGLFLPTLASLGLGCIHPLDGVEPAGRPLASYGKMAEVSKGKDTTSGHWEMAGCPLFRPFPVYPHGFPAEVVDSIEALTGRKVIGNKAASGTEIIAELGEEHLKTGALIVYTSADSVLQIAAHEDIVPVDKLGAIARRIRDEICRGEHAVGRVIIRPFIGVPGRFVRTANRHDYSLEPPAPTVLDRLKAAGRMTIGVGKIGDIFAGRGLTDSHPTKSNDHGMATLETLVRQERREGLIFANLVEFDSVYGHRNDCHGYARALERLDGQLALLLPLLDDRDLLVITADHGCDPTVAGTDHTREYVPLLAYASGRPGRSLGVRATFADLAATVAENFALKPLPYGTSFLGEITG
ncbi:phosphopentomutase [Anaeroselena agilis]|uniref:Phosphopentomutase n=1 Tax=Anaeroselena agilis TaxID=3063788 RepID=A0ABU3NWA8_9FIRM|nr:phosphopentomutase [Selenomonadales bacterium 4137-cl]